MGSRRGRGTPGIPREEGTGLRQQRQRCSPTKEKRAPEHPAHCWLAMPGSGMLCRQMGPVCCFGGGSLLSPQPSPGPCMGSPQQRPSAGDSPSRRGQGCAPGTGSQSLSSLSDHDGSALRQRLAHLLPAVKTKRELLSPVWAAHTSEGFTSACARLYPGTPAHPLRWPLPLREGLALAHLHRPGKGAGWAGARLAELGAVSPAGTAGVG